MAIQQTKSSLEESRGTQTTKGYLTVLVIITLLGTMLSAFDGIARSVALPLIAADLHFSTLFAGEAVSFTFLVTFVCNLVLGVLMDRWGRKNTFLVTMVAIALSCGFTAFGCSGAATAATHRLHPAQIVDSPTSTHWPLCVRA